ncbi:MAG: hypothetical protein ACI3WS_08600, partial [Phascolarctobacterium sp.]
RCSIQSSGSRVVNALMLVGQTYIIVVSGQLTGINFGTDHIFGTNVGTKISVYIDKNIIALKPHIYHKGKT